MKSFIKPQAEYLLHNGWEVTLICAEDSSIYKEIPKGVRYIPVQFKRGIDLFGVPKAIIQLYLIFKRARFNIVQYSTPNATFYSSTAAWLAHIPVRIYAQWGIRYVGFNGIIRRLFKYLEHWSCYCSTIIEPDSFSNLEYSIEQKLYPRHKGRVIWSGSSSGVNLLRFDKNQKENWRQKYRQLIGIKPHHLVIGFVGSIRRDKGCNELIAACRSLFTDIPNARLLLVGDKHFYNSIDKDLQDWASISSQVIHISPNNEVPQYLACMDIFALPTYREGLATAIIEAQAMGLPVVVSDVPGAFDAMRNEETGLVVKVKDVKGLIAALQILLDDPTQRSALGEAAYIFVRDNFEQKKFLQYVLKDKETLLISKS